MPFPPPLTSAAVRGAFVNPASGAPLPDDARASIAAVNEVVSPSGDVLLTTQPVRGAVAAGVVSWPEVLLSDSPGLAAQVTYRVRVTAPGFSFDHRFVLLAADVVAGSIDLALKAPSAAPPASADYVLAASRGVAGGVATLGSDGKVPSAQLPPGGGGVTDHGALSGLLDDDHTQYLLRSVADAAGDLLVGTAADAVGRLAVGADWTALRVDPAASPPLRWVRPDAGAVYPLREGWGAHSASVHPDHTTKGTAGFQGWQVRVWVPAGEAVTRVGLLVGTAASGASTFVAAAVYADDGGSLLGSSAHDDAWLKTTGLRWTSLQVPVAASPAGRFVRVVPTQNYSGSNASVLVTDFAATDLAFNSGTGVRSAFHNSLTSFPVSFDPSTGAGLPGWVRTGGTIVVLLG